ncbi:MAG: aminotransferase class III-fold pyridoxal phosphate-dependent enzyme [Deltaproteobacteria bacterium]|nr:aminotransferase class III-fold pyridoxal phosphate-dependent enzyme [Deltaproteobacteria bacterium]
MTPSFRASDAALHAEAVAAAGCDDFGDRAYREGFERILDAYDREARFHDAGRAAARAHLVQLLATRLRCEAALEAPGAAAAADAVRRPIVVLGLVRTGSTALHHLLAQDPSVQVLEYWLAARPRRRPPRAAWEAEPAFRAAAAEIDAMYAFDPGLRKIHLMMPDLAEECRHFLAQSFTDDSFEVNATVPSYVAWYEGGRHVAAYRRHRRLLGLVGGDDGRRWVLKYPVHLKHLDALLAAYPDACIVQTHRDPAQVMASYVELIAGFRAIYEGDIDRAAIASEQLEVWAAAAERAMATRARHDPVQFHDVFFPDFVADPIASVRAIYGRFGMVLSAEAEARMRAWQGGDPDGAQARPRRVDDGLGLPPARVRERFAAYIGHFGLATDARPRAPRAPGRERRARSAREEELLATARRFLPSGVRTPSGRAEDAMVVASARGARIVDASGHEYVDYLLGSGPLLLGHAHPAVVTAVAAQLERGASYLLVNEPAIRLAAALVELVPCAEAVTFHSTGSEATYYALRLARAFRGRDVVLKFEGAYHGMHDAALMSTQWTHTPAPFPAAVPGSRGIPTSAAADVLVAPFNDVATTTAIIERHHERIAAVIVEPLQRTIPPCPGFLAELRRITAHYGIVLVFDEVVTGFRLGLGGAQARYGVTPDLCALGKSISGGHPLGVVCGRREILALADPERRTTGDGVLLTGTYGGNPVSAAAALACIAELRRPGVYADLEATGRRLMTALQGMCDDAGIAAHVQGEPSVFQPWFAAAPVVDHRAALAADHGRAAAFTAHLLAAGVVKAHEKLFLSTVHGDEEIARTLAAFAEAVDRLRDG